MHCKTMWNASLIDSCQDVYPFPQYYTGYITHYFTILDHTRSIYEGEIIFIFSRNVRVKMLMK